MKRSHLSFLVVLASVAQFTQAGEVTKFRHCASTSNDRTQLELITYRDENINWIGGFVKYKGSGSYINLAFKEERIVRAIADRPSEVEYVWLEIIKGKITGEYRYRSQGANVFNLSYFNYSTKRNFRFQKFNQKYESGSCFANES